MPTSGSALVTREQSVRDLAAGIKERWREGDRPDAAAALAAYPDLWRCKSLVIDLAYEEFCLREAAGAAPEIGPFCDRFAAYRTSLQCLLDAHRRIAEGGGSDPVDWPVRGAEFLGLEIVGELGRGAFGRVYLAFDPETSRPCALKVSVGRSAEARVVGPLRHPHVIEVYWSRPAGRLTAVCMPLIGMSTLTDILLAAFPHSGAPCPDRGRALLRAIEPVGEGPGGPPVVQDDDPYPVAVAAVAARVADALRYLHQNGVAHGDLKPANVLLGSGGHPYLIDFNLATTAGAAATACGTLSYMAPEQLRVLVGKPGPVVPARADVYSLGVVLYEQLSGRVPAEPPPSSDVRTAAAAVLERCGRCEPPPVGGLLGLVLARCLAVDPADRPTAAWVANELDAYVRSARRPTRWPTVPAAFLLCGVAAAGLAVARPGWWPALSGQHQAVANESPVGSKDREPESADEYLVRGREFVAHGRLSSALNDFTAAYDRGHDPRALAYSAYCLGRMGQQGPAADVGQAATRAGATSAAVFNNLGYSLDQVGKPAQAIPQLDEALRRDPYLRAARYNRAVARHRAALAAGRAADAGAVEDIDAVLAGGELSPQLCYDAAVVYASACGRDPSLRTRARHMLSEAVRRGKDPSRFSQNPVLTAALGDDPAFKTLLTTAPGNAPAGPNLRLVEPD